MRRDERGNVAVMTGLLSVVLLLIAAFSVDFGMAYASKRQLQTAADSSVLAAAAVYAKYPGTCSTLVLNSSYKTEAQAAADSMRAQNRPGSAGSTLIPSCNAQGELQLTYEASGETPLSLGRLATDADSITTARQAGAQVDVGKSTGVGVRPYALCSADVPVAGYPTGVLEIKPPGQAHGGSDCAEAEAGGNWWFITCDIVGGGQSDGSPKDMAAAIEHGCTNTISVVSPQNRTTPATLSTSLTVNCKTGKPPTASCLDGDTGNSSLKNKDGYEAWGKILGQTIMLPVFCSDPTCAPDTVSGTGTNSRYPVYAIAGVVLCGYHIYDKASAVSNTGSCAGNTFTSTYVDGQDKKDVYFYFKFVNVLSSGSTETNDCSLGGACDAGLRRVSLSQ